MILILSPPPELHELQSWLRFISRIYAQIKKNLDRKALKNIFHQAVVTTCNYPAFICSCHCTVKSGCYSGCYSHFREETDVLGTSEQINTEIACLKGLLENPVIITWLIWFSAPGIRQICCLCFASLICFKVVLVWSFHFTSALGQSWHNTSCQHFLFKANFQVGICLKLLEAQFGFLIKRHRSRICAIQLGSIPGRDMAQCTYVQLTHCPSLLSKPSASLAEPCLLSQVFGITAGCLRGVRAVVFPSETW